MSRIHLFLGPLAALFLISAGSGAGVASQAPPTRSGLSPIPPVDLERLEPALRAQIEAAHRVVETLWQGGSPQAEELARAYATLGRLYQVYNMEKAAEAALGNARRLAPDDLRWTYSLALLYQEQGADEKAMAQLQSVLEADPRDLASLLRLGELHLSLGQAPAAAALFRRAIDVDDGSAAAHYGAARAAAALGETESAIAGFERTLALEPGASIVHYPLAQAYRRAGDLERARLHIEKRGLVEVSFADPRARELEDLTTLASFELVRALARKREGFVEEDFLGYTLSLLARFEGAIDELEGLLESWPGATAENAEERGRLHYALGGLLVHRGLDARAADHFRRAVDLAPALEDARVKLANTLARSGSYAEAAAELSGLLAQNPSHHTARLKRVAALMALDRNLEAREDLEVLVEAQPDNSEVRFRLGLVLEQVQRPEEAIAHYRAAARTSVTPDQGAHAHYRAGRLLIRQTVFHEARTELEAALALNAEHVEARMDLANLLGHLGDLEAALPHFRHILSRQPELEGPRRGEAGSLILLGRFAEARQTLEEGVMRNPTSSSLLAVLARLLAAAPGAALRDGPRALELARRLHDRQPSLSSQETLALALAATGDFAQAARLLGEILPRIPKGRQDLVNATEEKIRSYTAQEAWYPSDPQALLPQLPAGRR